MTRLNVLRAMGTGWGSAHAREPEENPGNKQIRRQLGESVRQSLPGPDAPPRGRGGWVGEGTGSCSSPDPLLLMLGRQWQSWAARTCRSSPGHLCGPRGQGHLPATGCKDLPEQTRPALASPRPCVRVLINTSIVHSLAQASPQRNTIPGQAPPPSLTLVHTNLPPASAILSCVDASCQWHHMNRLLCSGLTPSYHASCLVPFRG